MRRALGVCYYPEHWPEDNWTVDAARMAAAGLDWVRIGEFAWSRIEPVPGQYDWAWLDRAIAVLADQGLRIILGTPTCTPPRWMLDKYPDMLPVGADGRIREFGSRRHYCFSHPGYRAECAEIARRLVDRYGRDPRIHAWQVDNEYGNHATALSFSAAARDGFQAWLAHKYGTIDRLNAAWGNVFWSMEYQSFAQVGLPNATVAEANPSHWLDFRRFSSDQVDAFNRAQCAVLKAGTVAPLIHNFMSKALDFDHFRVAEPLDIASWDSYPLGYLEKHSGLGDAWIARYAQQGDPDFQAFHHDLYRAVGRGRWWIMEQQPGPVNWAVYNPAPLDGMVRLWCWEAFAHGAEAVCFFRWRQAPFGQEQMHAGLLRPDGSDADVMAEVAGLARELAELPEVETGPADVALVFDYQAAWTWQVQPQGRGLEYFNLVFDVYRAMRGLGLSVDILPPDATDLDGYKLVAVPGLATIGAELGQALATYAGQVFAGPRTGSKTAEFHIPADLPPKMPGRPCRITHVESLRPGATRPLAGGGGIVRWCEALSPDPDSARGDVRVVERHENGAPAVVAAGNVTYVGGWADDEAMQRMLARTCADAGIVTRPVEGGLRLRDAGRYRFVFNYGPDAAEYAGRKLEVGDVLWLPLTEAD